MRTTLKAVNDALDSLGAKVRLAKGDGYFYFDSGEAENWLDKTVSAATLSSRTVDECVEEYKRLKGLNRSILQGRVDSGRGSGSKPAGPPRRSRKS